MADTKISGLPAVTTPAGTTEIPVNEAGTNKKLTLAQINAYAEPVSAASVAAQTLGTADTYVTGSGLTVVPSRLQAGSFYRCVIDLAKTAAGTAIAVATVRMGTLGTTGDAAICTLTFPSAQTAAVNNGTLRIYVNFRSVGAGTAAVVQAILNLELQTAAVGFISAGAAIGPPVRATSAGFNSSTVTKIGVSINAGASSAWTTQLVQTDLLNIV
jgi:hypothetical protein